MPWNATTVRSSGFVVTAAVWNDELVENMDFLERVDLQQLTSDVSVTATTAAAAVTVLSVSGTLEAVPHVVRFHAARISNPAGAATVTHINLWEDSTDLNIWGSFRSSATGDSSTTPVFLEHFFTPTAASHTYTAKAWRVTANTTINAVAGTYMPAQMSLFRVPT